jgi:hypothetical protein
MDELDLDSYTVALRTPNGDLTLTDEQTRLVASAFPLVRSESAKWTRKMHHHGRLLIIDPRLVAQIQAFLSRPSENREQP